MEVYLDNAATTRVSENAAKIAEIVMRQDFGNPSSKHIKGFDAEQYIKNSAKIIADTLKVQPKEIIFTSGGTESNNMALVGAALANKRKGNKIIASCFEHASVYSPLLSLREFDFEVEFAPVDELGHIKMDELLKMIDERTILVSVMYVNNEIGAVQDIAGISKAIKEKKNDIIFHVDAIQAYGKYRIYPKKEGIDLLSVSGHKIHAPKGSGFLYVDEKVKLRPLIFGGGQQKNRRSGTENVPSIAGLGVAVAEMYEDYRALAELGFDRSVDEGRDVRTSLSAYDEKINRLYDLKKHFIMRINEVKGAHINAVFGSIEGDDKGINPGTEDKYIRQTAPHIVSVSFDKIKSEVLLHALEEKGVYVSSGSACSSNHPGLSSTLQAIGVRKELLDSTLRFSFSVNNTIEEIDFCIDVLKELVPIYSRFVRR